MQRSKDLFLITLVCGLFAGSAEAAVLSREQAENAVDAAIKAMGKTEKARVHDVLGCLPAFGRPKNTWVCVIDHDLPGRGRRAVKEYVFRQNGEGWTINPEADADGACAPNQTAQAAFRAGRNDPGLRVVGVNDDGAGHFTDSRGMMRDKKGPMRLLCTYEVRTGSGEKLSFLTYVWHDGQSYTIDPDWEIWD